MILPPDFANASPSWQESIYNQSHRLPERALARETPQHSWQPTVVNDACLTVLEQQFVGPADRSQVMAAGTTIPWLLVDYARTRKAKKPGRPEGPGIPLNVSVVDSAKQLDVMERDDAMQSADHCER